MLSWIQEVHSQGKRHRPGRGGGHRIAAFSAVVDALVKSVLMPLISLLVGEPNFDDFLAFGDVRFGVLLTAVVNFLLVASAIYFVIVAPMNRLIEHRNRKLGIGQDAKKEAAEDPQIALLKEIRDALQTQNQSQAAK
jgi:large conductance mechanosensitive channel